MPRTSGIPFDDERTEPRNERWIETDIHRGTRKPNLRLEMFASVTLQGESATRAYSLAQIVAEMSSSRYCRSALPHRDHLGIQ
jgi:hypothetical protein